MIAILFAAVFLGSLASTTLVISGWPLWLAVVVYFISGTVGIVSMICSPYFLNFFSRLVSWNIFGARRVKLRGRKRDKFLEPQRVPDLSEYLFSSSRK